MKATAAEVVAKFAPKADPAYRKAFADGGELLARYGITTPLRLGHFMAQCLHETGGLTILVESGRYTEKSLGRMWDAGNWHRYFKDRDDCLKMAGRCAEDGGRALFSRVYGGRMGNGGPETGDGWKYRGRGILQTTGRESYRKYGKIWKVDFEGKPELVVDPRHALKPALAEWDAKKLNAAADANDLAAVTRGINGGTVGLAERRAWFARLWPFVAGPAPAEHQAEWQVQAMLGALGYAITPDGAIGPKSKAAILDYRAKKGLPAVAAIDAPLLQAMNIG